jgi:hypothetical protein
MTKQPAYYRDLLEAMEWRTKSSIRKCCKSVGLGETIYFCIDKHFKNDKVEILNIDLFAYEQPGRAAPELHVTWMTDWATRNTVTHTKEEIENSILSLLKSKLLSIGFSEEAVNDVKLSAESRQTENGRNYLASKIVDEIKEAWVMTAQEHELEHDELDRKRMREL